MQGLISVKRVILSYFVIWFEMCYPGKMCMLHYMSLKLTVDTIAARLETCLSDAWVKTNLLKINKNKTVLIIFSPKIKSGVFPSCTINFIEASYFVKNLDVLFELSLGMDDQISLISKQCIYQLRHIGRIRNCKCLQVLSVFTRYL